MALLIAQLVVVASFGTTARCSVDETQKKPPSGSTTIVAERVGEAMTVPIGPELRLAPGVAATTTTAYRFRVNRTTTPDAGLGIGETFLVVPWAYDPACRFEQFGEDEWMPVGADGLFVFGTVDVRRHGGERLFNVLGAHTPYPQSHIGRAGADSVDGPSEWLTAEQLFDLYEALPDESSFTEAGRLRSALIEVFQDGPPVWASKRPGISILRRAYGMGGAR